MGDWIWVMVVFVFIGVSFYSLQKKKKGNVMKTDNRQWPLIDPTLEEVVQAVRQYAEKLPNGVTRTILVREDNQIDFLPLAPYLEGIPSRPFYMSKETYDIFEEADKHIPATIDKVQKAVDLYYKENQRYPVQDYDPLRKINYFQLLQKHYLEEEPTLPLYLTDYDGLVTHHKPTKETTTYR